MTSPASPQGSVREEDIEYERGDFWVHRDRARALYTVYRAGATHSTSDSSYKLTPDGRTLAVARANYLARRQADQVRWSRGSEAHTVGEDPETSPTTGHAPRQRP